MAESTALLRKQIKELKLQLAAANAAVANLTEELAILREAYPDDDYDRAHEIACEVAAAIRPLETALGHEDAVNDPLHRYEAFRALDDIRKAVGV